MLHADELAEPGVGNAVPPRLPSWERTRVGFAVLGAALGLGGAGDALLRATPWGINVPLWIGALSACAIGLLRWRAYRLSRDGAFLLGAALVFSACLALRDSGTLRFLNGLAALCSLALALAALRAWSGQVRVAALADYSLTVLYAGVHAAAGAAPLLFREISWRHVPAGRLYGPGLAALRGVFFAVPLLMVFGALFVAADASFERLVSRVLNFDTGTLTSHVFLVLVVSWLCAGLLRGAVAEGDPSTPLARRDRRRWLGGIEMMTVLGLLNLLFLAFVLVQLRYFFGGAATVLSTDGMTYAQYARRGFFELVTVAALVLPVLLVTHGALSQDQARNQRDYRVLAALLIGLLFVVMASALQRMFLYQRLYGLTELRVYTTAFMGWLGVVFVWFGATVLRGRQRRFAVGALTSALLAVLALNLLNPDSLIVRTNAARLATSADPKAVGVIQAFDDLYATSLSADAVPALVASLLSLPAEQRGALAWRLLHQWSRPQSTNWRTWNLGRSLAWAAVAAHQVELEAVVTAPPRRMTYRD